MSEEDIDDEFYYWIEFSCKCPWQYGKDDDLCAANGQMGCGIDKCAIWQMRRQENG